MSDQEDLLVISDVLQDFSSQGGGRDLRRLAEVAYRLSGKRSEDLSKAATQSRAEGIVKYDVVAPVSGMVTQILSHEPDLLTEAFENLYIEVCPDCYDPLEDDYCQRCEEEAEYPEHQYREVYEYWIVSEWLGRELLARGEVVAQDFYGSVIWGRGRTGQAIVYDSVIQDIANYLDSL
jgi:hypothetical protein